MQMHNFYNGLTRTMRTLLDTLDGGALMRKSANKAYKLLEDMALNNGQWMSEEQRLRNRMECMNWMFSTI